MIIAAIAYGISRHDSKNTIQKQNLPTVKNFIYLDKTKTADLDKDGTPEKYELRNGQLTISLPSIPASAPLWQSPSDWTIDDFVLADSDNDGIPDLNMSVWKPGNFGQYKPLWVKENDTSIKNHFFIFDLRQGKMQPKWQSSNLTRPNCTIDIRDIDGDHKNDLVVTEGVYASSASVGPHAPKVQQPASIPIPAPIPSPLNACTPQNSAVWKWNGWGFSKE